MVKTKKCTMKLLLRCPRMGYTPNTCRRSQVQSQVNNFVAHVNNDLILDAKYDVKDWWNQIDGLTEQPAIHVKISPEIQRYPAYVSPQTDLH